MNADPKLTNPGNRLTLEPGHGHSILLNCNFDAATNIGMYLVDSRIDSLHLHSHLHVFIFHLVLVVLVFSISITM